MLMFSCLLKSVSVWCRAHLLVFCLVWLLCCPTLCAFVHFVPCGTNLRCSRQVCVALCTHRASWLASLGRCTVHLQAPQLAALEAALVHNAAWPPRVGTIACRFTCCRRTRFGYGTVAARLVTCKVRREVYFLKPRIEWKSWPNLMD